MNMRWHKMLKRKLYNHHSNIFKKNIEDRGSNPVNMISSQELWPLDQDANLGETWTLLNLFQDKSPVASTQREYAIFWVFTQLTTPWIISIDAIFNKRVRYNKLDIVSTNIWLDEVICRLIKWSKPDLCLSSIN